MARSLYICYFGIGEPLVQTQVIPYLRELIKDGHEISLLTFEPRPDEMSSEKLAALKRELSETGIDWNWLTYHKRISAVATAYDIFRGSLFVRRMIRKKDLDILHGRSHVPTLMGALGRKLTRRKPKLLFDIRGFFPEEYTDAGIWPENGWLYQSAKRVERWLLKESDGFVVLTENAREILFPEAVETGRDKAGRPVEVIPCCVDMDRFQPATASNRDQIRHELLIEDRFVGAYVGAFGGWYMTEETADFFGALRSARADAFAMVLTQSDPQPFEALLEERGFGSADYLITKVSPADVPKYLAGADLAVSFIKPCYSKQASSPTKNAECLACGLPLVANAGVGDVNDLIERNGVGSLVHEFSADAYRSSIDDVGKLNGVGERCKEVARREFDLEGVGGERYRRLYRNLLGN